MERRAFLRGLLLAPLAVPVAAKAMAAEPSQIAIGGVDILQIVADEFRVGEDGAMTWAVRLDRNGYIAGAMPAFTVATVDGKPRITVRDEYIDALNDIAAEQNARLA